MLWQTSRRTFDLTRQGAIIGVLNVTPDSFSDGGHFFKLSDALVQARAMVAEGAGIIDLGGESTRPGALPVDEQEELRRVVPVIEALTSELTCAISIDTRKPAVARAALAAGAEIVNDITGLRDPAMRALLAETGAGAIAMHMQGEPRTMQAAPHYEDVVAEVRESFRQTWSACLRSGMMATSLAFDPGIGFGKTVAHNLALLQGLRELAMEDRPLVLGVSRKSFLGRTLGSTEMDDRSWPTVAVTAHARGLGARLFRVHEVRPNFEALRMVEAIRGA